MAEAVFTIILLDSCSLRLNAQSGICSQEHSNMKPILYVCLFNPHRGWMKEYNSLKMSTCVNAHMKMVGILCPWPESKNKYFDWNLCSNSCWILTKSSVSGSDSLCGYWVLGDLILQITWIKYYYFCITLQNASESIHDSVSAAFPPLLAIFSPLNLYFWFFPVLPVSWKLTER